MVYNIYGKLQIDQIVGAIGLKLKGLAKRLETLENKGELVQTMTQVEYDALPTKNPRTIYVIRNL